ncbi:cytochrome P450 [Trabulsiella odontotermitis]|uniref:cytochrome P450 n=1 Tax=Trabulsiella odontotermitis TaxID=379893 RepID=UPI0024B7C6EB|nr:cytochrome P450 [Trabulsiella odontotermitis]WHP29397.1 cytochrome P450 [Trabulsiella odontotermitis]
MRKLSQLPAPPEKGLLGHVYFLKKGNIHRQMMEWQRDYGSLYRLRAGLKKALVITDVDLIREILKARPHDFRRISNIEAVFEEAGMNGVFSSEGENWKFRRRIVEGALQPGQLERFHPHMQSITARFSERLDTLTSVPQGVSLTDEFRRYTADITTMLAFGKDMNLTGSSDNPVSSALQSVFPVLHRRCRSPFPLWRLYRSPEDKAFDEGLGRIKATLAGLIEEQRRIIAVGDVSTPENFLQAMVFQQREHRMLTDQDIIANALTLLLAGEDTTANTLAWTVYLLSHHPEAEQELIREIEQYNDDGPLPWPLPSFPWMNAVMKESMRLKPVAPQIYLEPMRDTRIGDVEVSKGTPLFLALHAGTLDEAYFTDAQRFDPSRWVKREGATTNALFPFGGGARMCPGRSLALTEIKMALHAIYSRYNIIPMQDPETVQERFAFTMAPQNLRATIIRR